MKLKAELISSFHCLNKSILQNISLVQVRKSHNPLTNAFYRVKTYVLLAITYSLLLISYSFTCWIFILLLYNKNGTALSLFLRWKVI